MDLKQAPCAWFDRLCQFLLLIGFHCNKTDPSLFTFYISTITVVLHIYLDDVLFTGNGFSFIQKLITQFGTEFAIKDLGLLHDFLSVDVKFTSGGVLLSQQKYTHDLLDRIEKLSCSSSATPQAVKSTPHVVVSTLIDAFPYHNIVGALQYLTFSCLDITHAVNQVCLHFASLTSGNLSSGPLSHYAFSDADAQTIP